MRCSSCQADNPSEFSFCGACGHPLGARQAAPPTGERRQLTILFSDVVGSTELADTLELEDYRDLIRTYQQTCVEVVEGCGGFLLQYLGDGVMACFGYPVTYEDSAARAVDAGLSILETISGISARIGIHTGMAYVGATSSANAPEASSVLGRVPNVAARLQALAKPGEVVISESTRRLVAGGFAIESAGEHRLKGIARPMPVSVVRGRAADQRRFSRALSQGLAPMVGRTGTRDTLEAVWSAVCDGQGQSVAIEGEAGIGKSRLIHELKSICEEQLAIVILCQCWERRHNTAFFPIIDMMNRTLALDPEAPDAEKLARLRRFLEQLEMGDAQNVALFAGLLSLPIPDESALAALTPRLQRERSMDAMCEVVLRMARESPLLLIVEDLQWVDPSTLEMLDMLRDQIETHAILAAFTSRDEIPWALKPRVTQISLQYLGDEDARGLVRFAAGDRTLPAPVVDAIVSRAGGIPLFLEELARLVVESERSDAPESSLAVQSVEIPTTLWDLLLARLEQVGAGSELAQLAATCGQRFSYDLIRAVAGTDEQALASEVDRFVAMELLIPTGEPLGSEFVFRHALLRDAIYGSLVREARQRHHGAIADALMADSSEGSAHPDVVADHLERAGREGDAVPLLLQAGQRASERSANAEAIGLLRRGLELLEHREPGAERLQLELQLRLAIASPLVLTHGYGADEVEQTYSRARELCETAGNAPSLAPVLLGVQFFYMVRARLATALETGQPLVRLAQHEQDPVFELLAMRGRGAVRYYSGDLVGARADLDRAIELYDPEKHAADAARLFMDSGVSCLAHDGMVVWLLGDTAGGLRLADRAIELSDRIGHAFSRVFAHSVAGLAYQLQGDVAEVELLADRAYSIAEEYRFAMALGWALSLRGWVAIQRGDLEKGLPLMEGGEGFWHATGARIISTLWSAQIAEAQGRMGLAEKGLTRLEGTLNEVAKSGEGWCLPELYRVRAELLVQAASAAERGEAEAAARKVLDAAIGIARAQSNLGFELRAATSRANLLQASGAGEAGRERLSEVVARFPARAESADLRVARELLAMAD